MFVGGIRLAPQKEQVEELILPIFFKYMFELFDFCAVPELSSRILQSLFVKISSR